MNENAQKIQKVINIISHLCPEVSQYSTISLPLALCVNELCDVRDKLSAQQVKVEETPME